MDSKFVNLDNKEHPLPPRIAKDVVKKYFDEGKMVIWRDGWKTYTWCVECGRMVQVNKPVFGSVHLCLED